MKKKIWLRGLGILALSLAFSFPAAAAAIPDGVYAGAQSLGGMEEEAAMQRVEKYVAGMAEQQIQMDVNGTVAVATAQELGFYWANKEQVETSLENYTKGNVVQRYFKKKDLEKNPEKLDIRIGLDEEKVADFVKNQCEPLVQEAVDATIHRENGAFVITPSQTGLTVDLDATAQALKEGLARGLDEAVQVQASVVVSSPKVTEDMLETIQDVLGTCSTSFSSSGSSRVKNLQVGSGKINGTVLLPGETLSGYEAMAPFTVENGYASAGAYENGRVVDSIGGGVCQIATTLYDAALFAELEITQRQNHSMSVGYVKPSMDAAIAGTYKDIKVTNPYDTPIYIEAGTSGRTLTFTIYGKETRPANRRVEYVSETLSVTDPGETIVQDASLAPGARVRVQSGHKGIRSRLWKYIYVDGVEQERTLLYTDTYNASKAVYHVGPAIPAAVPDVAAADTSAAETASENPAPVPEPKGPGEIQENETD